tara:strand:+ start:2462 stop:2917 length:456 start_codon:yes stop_codon:yes gene_type:complete
MKWHKGNKHHFNHLNILIMKAKKFFVKIDNLKFKKDSKTFSAYADEIFVNPKKHIYTWYHDKDRDKWELVLNDTIHIIIYSTNSCIVFNYNEFHDQIVQQRERHHYKSLCGQFNLDIYLGDNLNPTITKREFEYRRSVSIQRSKQKIDAIL